MQLVPLFNSDLSQADYEDLGIENLFEEQNKMIKAKAKGQLQKVRQQHNEEIQRLQGEIKKLEDTKSKADMIEENQELQEQVAMY